MRLTSPSGFCSCCAAVMVGLALIHASALAARPDEGEVLDAVRGGDVQRAAALLERSPRSVRKAFGPAKWTLLHGAVADRDTAMVALLLERGAEVNRGGSQRETPLHLAVATPTDTSTARRLRVLAILLAAGADPGALDFAGITPLHWAAMNGDVEGARLLIAHGADVNAAGRRQAWIPLHGAAATGATALVKLLLDSGSRLDVRDQEGRTPLAMARLQGQQEVAKLLEARGAPE